MPPDRVRITDYVRLLSTNRNFRRLWIAQVVSEMGDWFYSVAIFSFLLQVVGTAESVAFAFLCQVLPQTLVSPAAGIINDRLSRRKVMLFADWMRVAIVACMMLVKTRDMVWLLYVLLVCETVMWALFEPARNAVVPNIVADRDIPAANALGSTTWSMNFMLGAALGGLVATRFGPRAVFAINALSFAVSALFIRGLRFDEPHANAGRLRVADLVGVEPIAEGVRYVRQDARRFATLFAKAGIGLMGTNWVILPILGERVFPLHAPGFDNRQAGTMGMSVLLSMRGLGALLGGFLATGFAAGSAPKLRAVIFGGFCVAGAGYATLSAAPNLAVASAALVLAHAGGSAVWVASTTLLQQLTEDRLRGRVFSAEFAFMMLTVGSTGYFAGVAVDHGLDVRTMALITGGAMLIPAGLWAVAQRFWSVRLAAKK
jgi:MFS family permease